MTEEERLAKENAELKEKMKALETDRRVSAKEEHDEMKGKVAEVLAVVQTTNKKVDAVESICNHNAKRTRKIERRLCRGDTRFEQNDERIKVLERDFKWRKTVRSWAIKFATAIGLSWLLWKLGIKE